MSASKKERTASEETALDAVKELGRPIYFGGRTTHRRSQFYL